MVQDVKADESIRASEEFKEIERVRREAKINEASALNYAMLEGYAEGLTHVYIAKILEANGVPEALIQRYINGYEEGHAKGMEMGELKGEVEERRWSVRHMHQKGFSIETIAKALCLPKKGVEIILNSGTEPKLKFE